MMRLRTISVLLVLLIVGTLPLLAQTELYARKFLLPYPAPNATWGEAVGGVDFDGDGLLEIYAVKTNSLDGAAELVPAIYKWEINSAGDAWTIVWGDTLTDIPAQNTWPALTYGDWDQDGKMEIIWSPVNFFVAGNEVPDRVIVYEAKGDGSDVMGVDDGADGDFRPNARWAIETTPSYNLRPFKWLLHDIDSDGDLELIFCDRASSTGGVGYKFGVISVSDIPDNGDGSETWTLEASGKGLPTAGSTPYDVAVLDSTAYFFHATTGGTVSRIRWRDGAYVIDSASVALTPLSATEHSGGWKNVQVVDFDGDGNKEMIGAGYSSTTANHIWLLEVTDGGDSLHATELFDPDALVGASTRLLGSAAGDIDNDGNLDVIFGNRDSSPLGSLLRVEYKGAGAVTDPASYDFSVMESGYGSSAGQQRPDFFSLMNLDADPDLEIMYGMGYTNDGNYDFPLIILDRLVVPNAPITIAEARIDANIDYVPDLLGQTVTIIGTVTTPTFGSSTQFNRYMEDGTAGVDVFMSGLTAPVVSYDVKERLYVTGEVQQYNGLTEIVPATMVAVVPIGPVYRVTPTVVTVDQLLANGEAYEGRFVSIKGLAKTAGSAAWPNPGSSSNMTMWDGGSSVTMRVVSYTEVDDSAEVTYPVDFQGIVQQFDGSAPYSTGYQISPRFYSDFAQGVSTSPNPKFALVSPTDGSTITLDDSAQVVTFNWNPAIDLDGDPITYAWAPIGGSLVAAADTTLDRTGVQLLAFFGTADTVDLMWRVAARENKTGGVTVYSVDTLTVTLIKGNIVSDVEGYAALPEAFALDQNYPNPFNPTTTIRVALPNAAFVTLKVYNMLGQEVATLVEGEKSAGYVTTVWNGRDQYGSAVASGVYIYRVVAQPVGGGEDFVTQKKMMMLK
jgi:hypothetical protein